MKTIIVTRHPAAIDFIKKWHDVDEVKSHLTDEDIASLKLGDHVIGVLPINLAAKVCERTNRAVTILSMDVPPHLRGKELTLQDMEACNALLTKYVVMNVS